MSDLSKVVVIGTGGTIHSIGKNSLDIVRYGENNTKYDAVQLLEAGHGVGGTWYWNRYPGARFDSESYTYAYLFS